LLNLLEIDSVLKAFDDRQVLTDIYLKCQTGDIIGTLGRNGSGKSTLLQTIFGSISSEKFVKINGAKFEDPYKLIDQICYLPQHDFIPKHLTVKKVIELYLGKEMINDFLSDKLLHPVSKDKIYGLSGGELRYFEIKLLLNTKSKFIMLDEPFNGVAPVMIEVIKSLIKEKSVYKGIILTDHDYRNVLDIANKNYVMFDGSLKKIIDKSDLVKWGYINNDAL
jgi:lipopolysaccharide export system ATP-binding protein